MLIVANIGKKAQGSSSEVGGQAWTLSYVEDGTSIARCVPDCNLEHYNLRLGDQVYCVPILEHLSRECSHRGCLVLKQEGEYYRRRGFCILRNVISHKYYANQEGAEKDCAIQYSPDLEVQITIR